MNAMHELILEKAADLPNIVQPMLHYAETLQPDAIIVCDRNARPLGVAMEEVIQAGGADAGILETLWYRRISKRLSQKALAEHCGPIIEKLREVERPKVMVIDDHVSTKAGTAHLFRGALQGAGLYADIHWTTLTGRGTALNLKPYISPSVEAPWRDRPEILGFDYEGLEYIATPTPESQEFYQTIHDAAQREAV